MSICGPPDFSYRRILNKHACARAVALLLLYLGASIPPYAMAACKSPLPIESLRDLDQRIDADPAGIGEEVRRQLSVTGITDELRTAALYAVSADAYNLLDDDDRVRLAVADGRERLRQVPDGDAKRTIEFRLDLLEADSPRNRNDMAASVERLIKLEQALPVASLDRVCLLIVRSRLSTQLLRDDEATTDANEAYRIATARHLDAARAEASYQLAVTYLRVGLLDDAVQFVDQAANYERATRIYARLSNALYVKADILDQMRRYDDALAAISEARALNVALHQAIDVAFDDQKKCQILLDSSQLEIAEQTCRGAQAVLAASDRADLVAVIQGSLARIELLRGRFSDSIARLDRVLNSGVDRVPAKTLLKLYQYRSEALGRTGRFKDALRDLQEVARLTTNSDLERRRLAAARIKERFTAQLITSEIKAIETHMQIERRQADLRRQQLRLSLALAIIVSLLLIAITLLMWKSARRERALRSAGETLEAQAHMISNVREGIVLIDNDTCIQYANLSASRLLGRTPEQLVGSRLSAIGLSAEALRVTRPDALTDAAAGASEVHLADATGRRRTVVVTTSAVDVRRRALIVCVLHDVTELRHLEREVLALASRERDQQSGEVHEGIAQDLAGIALFLKGLVRNNSADPAELEFIVEHINRVIARSRALARGLAPVQVAGGSLAIALQRLAADVSATRNFSVVCKFNADEQRLSATQADQLYRIAQECLRIVEQQANCREAAIELRSSGGEIELTIIDDAEDNAEPSEEIKRAWDRIAYFARALGGSVRRTGDHRGRGTRTTIALSLGTPNV